jgi:alkylation response protein AidB-like acyl-CoA dehydrogenase
VQFGLSPREEEIRERGRELVDQLIPYELAVDEANDDVPLELELTIRRMFLGSGLFAPNFPVAWGGAGLTLAEQVVLEEQVGRLTNCLWSALWRPSNVLIHATPAQRERYVHPNIRGERRGCYAITEPEAGSDVSSLQTIATPTDGGYRINGDKWFVTGGDEAEFLLVVANVPDTSGAKPTIFFVDRDAEGLAFVRTPRMTHSVIYGHPEIKLENVFVAHDMVLGDVGQGISLTHDWFREERLMIAARCLGAAARCIELAHEFAESRVQFGAPIIDNQAIQWMLADNATELAAAQALTYKVAADIERGIDVKEAHGRASMAKLYASEMVDRVTDRCVQIFGGRGYLRENPVERLSRDYRVDRIWEGTSEMQRLIISRAIRRRGLGSLIES